MNFVGCVWFVNEEGMYVLHTLSMHHSACVYSTLTSESAIEIISYNQQYVLDMTSPLNIVHHGFPPTSVHYPVTAPAMLTAWVRGYT